MRLAPSTSPAARAAVVALASAGALVAVAAVALPATGSAGTGTARTKDDSTTPSAAPTTSDSSAAPIRSSFDFEDGTTQGWSAPGPRVEVAARTQARLDGMYGLQITGLKATTAKKPEQGPHVVLDARGFERSGSYRHISLWLGTKQPAANPCRTSATRQLMVVNLRVRDAGRWLTGRNVTVGQSWSYVDLGFPGTDAATMTLELTYVSGPATPLWIDDVQLYRSAPPEPVPTFTTSTRTSTRTTAPTPTPTRAGAPLRRTDPAVVARASCTRKNG